jgi:hypothetical protein
MDTDSMTEIMGSKYANSCMFGLGWTRIFFLFLFITLLSSNNSC